MVVKLKAWKIYGKISSAKENDKNTDIYNLIYDLYSSGYNNKKIYGKSIQDISFNVKAGELIALIGSNGAGKSTLINTIVGVIKPDSGDIFITLIILVRKIFLKKSDSHHKIK